MTAFVVVGDASGNVELIAQHGPMTRPELVEKALSMLLLKV